LVKSVNERPDVVALIAEIFRDLGYEGAALSRITERTGVGKGSLYHFFPGGKEEMATAVLQEIDSWFERNVFSPLRHDEPADAIAAMWKTVGEYFRSGDRICLPGAFALEETRDRFSSEINGYFRRWVDALRDALIRGGMPRDAAVSAAEDGILTIQGALVLSRALDDRSVFTRALARAEARIERERLEKAH
jgi:TetR/AcrR family transcriptional regulator, lmrAB and yxaGH operons repressor